MARLKRWDKFAAEQFDPPLSKRVGKRLITAGEIAGDIIDGWPWVDMEAWHQRDPTGSVGCEDGIDLLS